MARFTTAGGEGSGAPGPQGPAGDSAYDIAVENGFVGTEQEWLDSIGGSANIADFVFNYDEEDTNSTITIHNHDMVIQTTRDGEEDSDISLNSADDIWMNANDDIEISASNSIYLNGTNGVYLGTTDEGENNPNNQVATIGDIDNIVSNGTVRYSPTFTATGLEFTGSGETYPTYNSYYVKSGSMVSFVIEVDLSTVTNFGTGQYKLQLPFTPAFGFNHFSGWAQVDTTVNPDVPNGHVILNVDHAGVTDVLDLHYLKQAGGAHTPIIEGLFLQGTPVTLTTSSKIYINGTYIMQGLP